jgi:RNA 3'-terminal phosphate cyclase (ATP)
MIELDGSMGEGGGQILRTSLALSLITGRPFRLREIRAGRPKPGLHPQHLMSVRAAATIGQAKLSGDAIGSRELVFEPGEVKAGKYRFAIGTAGATGLVLHTIYLPLAWKAAGPSELVLEGGTHVSTSPCFHFLQTTWNAWMEHLGLHLKLKMNRTGFYPRGGGQVEVAIQPCQRIRPLTVAKREPITRASGFSAVAGLPEHIAQRQARRAKYRLRENGIEAEIIEETWSGGPGSVLAIIFDCAPAPVLFFGLGARGKPAEKVADEAVSQALAYAQSGEPVDPHSADQIVLPLALCEDASEFRVSEVTRHLITNIAVIQHFISRDISCEGAEGDPGVVRFAADKL